ncbi:MAG TPA: hypothetical protein VHX86_04245 [Tepidisphaeraceae bacterium]|jgi:tetratricopeptide (TPR) repeat protein|nr:hypothetical protein [Tepidisphaeraceae bacterium]
MRKLAAIVAPVALAVCIGGMLNADDSAPPASPDKQDAWVAENSFLWGVEHTAAIAKDPDAAGIEAVFAARALLKTKEPQVAIDFFNKALYDSKSRTVQREIRIVLCHLYEDQGQNDKALDEAQMLIADQ